MDRNLFQIYLSDADESLPPPLREMQDLHLEVFKNYNYYFYGLRELRSFIQNNFAPPVLEAYDSLRPYAYKADLGRYCLVYYYGGWYSDITLKPLMLFSPDENPSLIYFYDHGNGASQALHGCQNGLFYASRKHPVLADAIDQIIKNCKNKYYGPNPLSPTGPNLFGNKIVNYSPSSGVYYGYFRPLTPDFKKLNRAYVGPSGDILSLHKTAWFPGSFNGSLESFGAKGVNNYLDMWLYRQVYV